jgi:hypothetical protein
LHHKTIGAPKKFKNWPRPLFRPRTNHTCHQKPNSRDIPVKGFKNLVKRRGLPHKLEKYKYKKIPKGGTSAGVTLIWA